MNLPIPANTICDLQLLQQMQVRVQGHQEEIELLKHENASLKHQLDWFKRKRLNRGQTPPICRDRILTDWPRISLSKFAVSDPGYPGQDGG